MSILNLRICESTHIFFSISSFSLQRLGRRFSFCLDFARQRLLHTLNRILLLFFDIGLCFRNPHSWPGDIRALRSETVDLPPRNPLLSPLVNHNATVHPTVASVVLLQLIRVKVALQSPVNPTSLICHININPWNILLPTAYPPGDNTSLEVLLPSLPLADK